MASTKDEMAEREHDGTLAFIANTKSPYHCIVCVTYVGYRHALLPRTAECKLGSEC
jgi:hypothetical protein